MNSPDRYDIEARYAPALVCSVPFLFFGFYFFSGLATEFWHSAFAVNTGTISLSSAIFFVLVHFCRMVGKIIEEKMYRDGLNFPTTTLLLDNSTNLSEDRKAKIIAKIKSSFGTNIKNRTEGSDSDRRLIHESVGQIRSLFYKKSPMLLQRNIQFGFAKNLLGGSILATLAAIIGLILSKVMSNEQAAGVSLLLVSIYAALALFSYVLVRFTAKHYAHTLYDEFLSYNKVN